MKKVIWIAVILSVIGLVLTIVTAQNTSANFNKILALTREEKISPQEAKEIAYINAGVPRENISLTEIDLDIENGNLVYDVEFYCDGVKYSSEVYATEGNIVKYEKETKSN